MSHISAASFEARYRAHPDPWSSATSSSEIRRFEITMAHLPPRRFRRGFEPACASGELTWRLAARCDRLEALDCSSTAIARARARVRGAGMTGVSLEVGELPADWPGGRFDLVVFSELGYYFDRVELARLREMAIRSLVPAGVLVGVHRLGAREDHLLSGDDVHAILGDGWGLAAASSYRGEDFRLDVWERR